MRLLYLHFMLLIAFQVQAQQSPLSFGLQAGLGLSGSSREVQLDRETSDHYHRGQALLAGVQLRYRFGNHLAVVVSGQLQRMRDNRTRLYTPWPGHIDYTNQLHQILVPISLQWEPSSTFKRFYLTVGAGPRFLLKGITRWDIVGPQHAIPFDRRLEFPLNIPPNRHLKTDWILSAGAGFFATRKLAFEVTCQAARAVDYAIYDPGPTFVLPPVYSTRASRGWLLSAIYWFN